MKYRNNARLDRVLFAVAWTLAILSVAAMLFVIPQLEARITALEARVNPAQAGGR